MVFHPSSRMQEAAEPDAAVTAVAAMEAEEEDEEEDIEETEDESSQETRRLAICWKITKRGKLRKIVREVYLREDIKCGIDGCCLCYPSGSTASSAQTAAALVAGYASPSKRSDVLASEDTTTSVAEAQTPKAVTREERILLPDATALLQHAAFFEEEQPYVSRCLILSSVLNQVRSKNMQTYATVHALCVQSSPPSSISSRRPDPQQQAAEELPTEKKFFLFNNEFALATYVERRPDETFDEQDVRAVFAAARWLQQHLNDAAAASSSSSGVPASSHAATVTLLTSDPHFKEQAQQQNLRVLTVKEYAEEMRLVYPDAGERLAFLEEANQRETQENEAEVAHDTSSAAGACGGATSSSSSKKKGKPPLFTEHLREAAIASGLRTGALVKGMLRMLQDCCWRGVVISGGEEIRIRGRAHLNRAMEGDVVAVEILQQQEVIRRKNASNKKESGGKQTKETEEIEMESKPLQKDNKALSSSSSSSSLSSFSSSSSASSSSFCGEERTRRTTTVTASTATTPTTERRGLQPTGAKKRKKKQQQKAAEGGSEVKGVNTGGLLSFKGPVETPSGIAGVIDSERENEHGKEKEEEDEEEEKKKKKKEGEARGARRGGGHSGGQHSIESQERKESKTKQTLLQGRDRSQTMRENNFKPAQPTHSSHSSSSSSSSSSTSSLVDVGGVPLLHEEAEEHAAAAMVVYEEAAVFPSADLSDSEIEKLEQLEMGIEEEETKEYAQQQGEEEEEEEEEEDDEEKEEELHKKPKMKEGKVMGIIRKGRRELCGTLRPFDNVHRADAAAARAVAEVVFIPSDRRFPNVLIRTRRYEQLADKRLVVVVDTWDRYSRYPRGHWTEVLGDFGSAEAEAAVILREHGVVSRDFSLACLRCLPPSNWSVEDLPLDECRRRLDLRGICVCSIDPPGCKDIDDALSIEVLPSGNYRVGVHIADVTYYLREGSALDEEAAGRCTTVYLVERRTDMLPALLTTDLCSLVADKDRLAFSVLWEMTPEGTILSSSVHKTIIHSRAALTYAEAQSMIDDLTDQTELAQNLRRLMTISKTIRARRMQQGALQLASPDVQIIRETITEENAAEAARGTGDNTGAAETGGAGGGRGRGSGGAAEEDGDVSGGDGGSNGGGGGRVLQRHGGVAAVSGRGRGRRGDKTTGIFKEGSSAEKETRVAEKDESEFHAEEVVQTEASDITLYQARDTNRMVEDLMLLANITVAERVVNYFPYASLLRRHPPPKEKRLKALKELLKRAGIDEFRFASSKEIGASLSRVAEQSPHLDFLVRVLTTRCMEQAVYFSTADAVQQQQQQSEDQDADISSADSSPLSNVDDATESYNAFFRHYGLAAPIYTHFTSPIRRYADVIIHRMLAAAIGIAPVPAICGDKQKLSQQCELLNLKHRNAQLAGRSSVQYYVYRYFKKQGEKEAVGVITKVKRNGFSAYIHKYGLEGVVFVKEDDYDFDVTQQQLRSKQSSQTLSAFDEVLLRVAASQDNFRPSVNMTLLRKKDEPSHDVLQPQ